MRMIPLLIAALVGVGFVAGVAVAQPDDCNQNGVPDRCDIDCNNEGCEQFPECGTYPDCNGNDIPDECEGEAVNYELEVGKEIPDNDPNGLVSVINVGDSGTIADINVAVTVTHTNIGDLTIDIAHGGVVVRLWDRQCGDNNDLDIVFDDEGDPVVCAEPTAGRFQPVGSLSDFDFGELNGDWTLTVADNNALDVGTLVKWGFSGTLRDFECCVGNLLSSDPPDGAIDARELHEFDNPQNLTGIHTVLLTFDDNTSVVAQCFDVEETGGGQPPAIESVERLPGNEVRVNFDRPITEQQWTSLGYNGPRGQVVIDIGFLPGDVNQTRQSNGRDVSELIDCLNEVIVCADYQTDINRSGDSNGNDITRLINVLQSVPQDPRAWLNETIVEEPNP